jgi:hypothetical protein
VSELRDAAVLYAGMGWPVFPLRPRGKQPLTDNGFHDATTDPERVGAWWFEHPGANIGIACGHACDVLDVDGPQGRESLARLLADLGVDPGQRLDAAAPPGWVASVSGRDGGGTHFWFAPGGPVRWAGFRPHLDWLGLRGYVIAPPSRHPSGRVYRWLAGGPPELLPPAPAGLHAAATRPVRQRRPPRDPDGPPAGERPGDDFNARMGWGELLQADGARLDRRRGEVEYWTRPDKPRGVSASVGYQGSDLLTVFTCNWPGLAADTSYSKFGYWAATRHGGDHAAAARDLAARGYGHRPASEPPSSNGHRPVPAPATEQEDRDAKLLAGLRNGAWLDAQDFPPLAYAVPDLIPEGVVLKVGPPKIGKSWMVLGYGLAVADGGKALGTIAVGPARPVLYLALEDGDRRMQDRCRRLLGPDPIPARLDYLTHLEPGQVLATIAAWLRRHGGSQPLVILDTLGKVMPPALPGESAYQRDYRVGSALKELADAHPGATLLVNHHDRKAASADFVDSVSGTNGLAGAADTILVLTRDRNETAGLLQVTGRDIPEGEYALCFTDGHCWQLDGADLGDAAKRARDVRATAGLGDRSAEVIRFAGEHPQGVTPAQVAQALGVEQNAARAYLSRLAEAGRLSKPRRGLYTPVASVATVASEGGGTPERNTRNGSNTPPGGLRPLEPARPDLAAWE